VYLVYNEFKSVMAQRLVVERLLPIPRLEADAAPAAQIRAGVFGGEYFDRERLDAMLAGVEEAAGRSLAPEGGGE
jgi:F0F1-type ATP synthase gamma subunit